MIRKLNLHTTLTHSYELKGLKITLLKSSAYLLKKTLSILKKKKKKTICLPNERDLRELPLSLVPYEDRARRQSMSTSQVASSPQASNLLDLDLGFLSLQNWEK